MTLRSPRSEFVRKALLALAPALLLLATAGNAAASNKQESIFQDDRFFGDPAKQIGALDTVQSLGVDTVHVVVGWRTLAPSPDSKKKPKGFNGADPADYPAESWDRFDGLVREATKRHINLLLSPAGPIPAWATDCKSTGTPAACRPNVKEYTAFFTAVVKRYSGKYSDANSGGKLPKVSRFSVWNEPNLRSWIQTAPNKSTVAGNAGIYRNLVYAAQTGLVKGKQPRATLLIGELAPLNDSLAFYYALFCIDSKGKSLKGGAAKKASCKSGKRIKRFKATGIAHHPYTRGGQPPFKRGHKNDLTLADISKLEKAVTQGAKAGAVKRGLPIYFTEFGVSTNPPDTKFGVSPDKQAEALNHAEYVGYLDKNVRAYSQFQLSDDTTTGQNGDAITFQTGLRSRDDTPKASFGAYRVPIYVTKKGGKVRVWGGARPGRTGDKIEIQTGSDFKTVKTVKLSKYGYIDTTIAKPSGKVRLKWTSGGTDMFSREASVASK